ncbi:hypothetical protein INR76_03775 [Marixanthomonas sp. SCSIO 43207]|uniref:hypothetical protein n=1 Tax=Marixanthomonas sp. SCSIO 43207 TaxID=2779360 RepID=UPI001CA9F4E8|nr:hypothetical protein [Marixanthomonas sp. SCSIO 43207]UAB81887.1 hypothetical protein INR76_03775 [Marixanthomonas sp. SCSIO 43207]
METSSTLIGLAIVLIFMGPIILIVIKSSSTEKRLKKNLQTLSSKNDVSIHTSEIIGNTIIGLDESIHKLVFSNTNRLTDAFKTVDLNTVKECKVTTFKESKKPITRVAIELINSRDSHEIIFYEEDDESNPATDVAVCLNRANYWEKTINRQLRK